MQKENGFKRSNVSTNYKFNNYRGASQVIKFLYKIEMGDKVLKSKSSFVEEYTEVCRKRKGEIRT